MIIRGLIFEDFVNYHKCSMTIMMPYCNFKCDKECGCKVCQNSPLIEEPAEDFPLDDLLDAYLTNSISEAVVFQGLEPFDSYNEMYEFIQAFVKECMEDIVIYTGYTEEEIADKVAEIVKLIPEGRNRLIIKYGRYIPDQEIHFDDVLGVCLASDNQYAKVIVN